MNANSVSTPIILGCGYLGKYLTKQLLNVDCSPICVIQSQASLSQLKASGLNAVIYDLDRPQPDNAGLALSKNQIYYLAPPSHSDDKDHRMDHFLDLCRPKPPQKIVYISTSGVYGDCQGNWVTEESPLAPISTRAKRRVYAETALVKFCHDHDCNYVILRVGGIYGPNRLPIQRLKEITVLCPEDAPHSNRIHVADLAATCYSAMSNNILNEVINVADGHSTSMTDYYYKIADFAGLPRPHCVPMSQAQEKLSAGMLSFVNESRRLSTQKMNALLNIQIQFPTLELGLEDCFKKTASKNL